MKAEASDVSALDAVLPCTIGDRLLREYLPVPDADGQWLKDPSRLVEIPRVVGTIATITPKQVSKLLSPYKAWIDRLAKDHTLVQAVATDNNGMTIAVVICVRVNNNNLPKVFAVFARWQFEE